MDEKNPYIPHLIFSGRFLELSLSTKNQRNESKNIQKPKNLCQSACLYGEQMSTMHPYMPYQPYTLDASPARFGLSWHVRWHEGNDKISVCSSFEFGSLIGR
jgi:hypothetical protein